jgi:tricarballylate dehydrogenase
MDEAPDNTLLYIEEHCRQINQQTQGIAYFVFDAAIDEIPMWRRMIRSDQAAIEAPTLIELAAKIGVPARALEQTVAEFNAACPVDGIFRYGRDDAKVGAAFENGEPFDWEAVFDHLATDGVTPPKSNWSRPLTKGPYGCYPIISSNTFTCGGLKTTKDGEVVRTSGAVIPGLYAAGETMGIIYGIYIGATSVLRAVTFGRRAGAHAARVARA